MKLKAPDLVIPVDDPFTHDSLKRKESVDILSAFIASTNGPLVLAVNAPWGMGKTTFIKMWMQNLTNNKFKCFYFNAWENDFSDDALVSLIGEIEGGIENLILDPETKGKAKKYFLQAKKLSASLIKKSLPITIKVATAGALELEDFTEKSLADLTEKIAKDKIDKYESDKKSISHLRKKLTEFSAELVGAKNGNGGPLIFFIDELDRCRPTYAIELMEKAKHLFSVQNIIFVLSVDKDQLGHSVRSVYGAGMDVDGYLRRFVDIEYHLPSPNVSEFGAALFDRFEFGEFFKARKVRDAQYEPGQLLECFSKLVEMMGLSLRVYEQCFSQLSIAFRTTPSDHLIYPLLLTTLIAIRAGNPNLYREYTSKRVDADSVISYFRKLPGGKEFLSEKYGRAIQAYLISAPHGGHEIGDVISRYQQRFTSTEITEVERQEVDKIFRILQQIHSDGRYGTLSYLVPKIEITQRFVN